MSGRTKKSWVSGFSPGYPGTYSVRSLYSKYMPVHKILDKITNFQKIKNLPEKFKKLSLLMSMPKGQLQRTNRARVMTWRRRRLEIFCSHPQISSWGADFYRDPYTNPLLSRKSEDENRIFQVAAVASSQLLPYGSAGAVLLAYSWVGMIFENFRVDFRFLKIRDFFEDFVHGHVFTIRIPIWIYIILNLQ